MLTRFCRGDCNGRFSFPESDDWKYFRLERSFIPGTPEEYKKLNEECTE